MSRASKPHREEASGGEAAPLEDAALARAARAGEEQAFAALVERYAGRLFQHLYRIVGQREEAEDLTQEVFLKAYRALHQFDSAREFRSWMYAIATNTARNALRTRARRIPQVDLKVGERLPAPAAAIPVELQEQIALAMQHLSPQTAALVDLYYREGMSIREAAETLGLSEGAAKVTLHRARKQLRERLLEDSDG